MHGIADAVNEWITGQRGYAQSRIASVRDNAVRILDSDGANEVTVPVVGDAMSPSWHPAGTMIAYNTYGPQSRIIIYDLRTGRNRDFAEGARGPPGQPVESTGAVATLTG